MWDAFGRGIAGMRLLSKGRIWQITGLYAGAGEGYIEGLF